MIPRKSPCAALGAARILLLRCLVCAVAMAGRSAADPPPCDEIAGATGYRVVLDSLSSRVAPGITPAAIPSPELIQYSLENAIENVRMQSEYPIAVVRCARTPQAADFGKRFAQKMYDSQVLLEVWGGLEIERDSLNRPYHRARLNYALIPICRMEPATGLPPGVYTAVRQTKPGANATQAVSMFEGAIEFQAYAAISTGIKAWNIEEYEIAAQFLCLGSSLLEQAAAGAPSAAQQRLAAYVRELSRSALLEARKDPSSALSLLTEAQVLAACGGTP